MSDITNSQEKEFEKFPKNNNNQEQLIARLGSWMNESSIYNFEFP